MAKTLRSKRINQIIYLSLGGAILAIILFIILFNNITGKKNSSNSNSPIAQKNSLDEYIEQANSSIGKKVNEEYQDLDENEGIQVQVNDEKMANVEKENGDETKSQNENAENKNSVDANTKNADNKNNVSSDNNGNNVNNSSIANLDDLDNDVIFTNATENDQTQNNTIDEAHKNETQTSEENVSESKDPVFKMPVEGEITKHYGKEKLIYSDTLKEWTTHLGIDIKADKTTIVKSASDGVVKSVKNDPRYGLTVVVEHGNGFSSVYSNLLTAEFVVVGENVKSGQTLGTVGNSATFEILDDSHLHFEILKDGNSIDPEMYLK